MQQRDLCLTKPRVCCQHAHDADCRPNAQRHFAGDEDRLHTFHQRDRNQIAAAQRISPPTIRAVPIDATDTSNVTAAAAPKVAVHFKPFPTGSAGTALFVSTGFPLLRLWRRPIAQRSMGAPPACAQERPDARRHQESASRPTRASSFQPNRGYKRRRCVKSVDQRGRRNRGARSNAVREMSARLIIAIPRAIGRYVRASPIAPAVAESTECPRQCEQSDQPAPPAGSMNAASVFSGVLVHCTCPRKTSIAARYPISAQGNAIQCATGTANASATPVRTMKSATASGSRYAGSGQARAIAPTRIIAAATAIAVPGDAEPG